MPLVLFNPKIRPYQVIPRRARVGLGAIVMKGVLHVTQIPSLTRTSQSDCLVSYPGHSLRGLSTAPAD